MSDIKEKESLNKVRTVKQVTFADEHPRPSFRKTEATVPVNQLKPRLASKIRTYKLEPVSPVTHRQFVKGGRNRF